MKRRAQIRNSRRTFEVLGILALQLLAAGGPLWAGCASCGAGAAKPAMDMDMPMAMPCHEDASGPALAAPCCGGEGSPEAAGCCSLMSPADRSQGAQLPPAPDRLASAPPAMEAAPASPVRAAAVVPADLPDPPLLHPRLQLHTFLAVFLI